MRNVNWRLWASSLTQRIRVPGSSADWAEHSEQFKAGASLTESRAKKQGFAFEDRSCERCVKVDIVGFKFGQSESECLIQWLVGSKSSTGEGSRTPIYIPVWSLTNLNHSQLPEPRMKKGGLLS